MSSYFGIDAADAARSGLAQYSADEGFKDVSFGGGATYRLFERVSISALAIYTRLIDDAADSPVVDDVGDENQIFRWRAGQLHVLNARLDTTLVRPGQHGSTSACGKATRMTIATRSVWSAAALAALLVVMTSPVARSGAGQTPAQDVTAVVQGQLGEQVLNGCNTELARFCAEVTPGEERLLACLYAHGDKLTKQCDYALDNRTLPRSARARYRRHHLCRRRVSCGTRDALRGCRCRRRARRAVPEHACGRAQPRLRPGAGRSGREIRLAAQGGHRVSRSQGGRG